MAKKGTVRKVVVTVEGWVGMGPEAPGKKTKTAKKSMTKKSAKDATGKKKASKKTKKKFARKS